MLSNTYAWRLQPAFLSIFFFCQYAGIYLDIILGNESETDFYSWKSNEGRYFPWNSNLKKNTLCSARERARAHHLRVRWSEWQNVNLNIFHFFCVLEIVQLIQMTIFSSLSHQLKIKWQTLTSTIKRPAGSPSTAISKNTRGNAIFLLAKLRRHNWIKLDWLAKWFWFSVCRRLIERACRHSVPATREAIFLHVLRIDDVMVLCVCVSGKCECMNAQGIIWCDSNEKSTAMNEFYSMCVRSVAPLSTLSLQFRCFAWYSTGYNRSPYSHHRTHRWTNC